MHMKYVYREESYARDHNPPHVLFEYSGVVVRIDIIDVAVMSIAGKATHARLC